MTCLKAHCSGSYSSPALQSLLTSRRCLLGRWDCHMPAHVSCQRYSQLTVFLNTHDSTAMILGLTPLWGCSWVSFQRHGDAYATVMLKPCSVLTGGQEMAGK